MNDSTQPSRLVAAVSSLAIFGLVLVTPGQARADVLINACGQTSSGLGYLDADLDCTGFVGPAVIVNGGTFDLRGHTLNGGERGVACDRPCEITSTLPGGTISNCTENAISSRVGFPPVAITVSELTLLGNYDGILNDGSKITATNVTLTATTRMAIGAAEGRVRGEGVTISGGGWGVFARFASLKDSVITDVDGGVVAHYQLRMNESTVSATTVSGLSGCGAMRIRASTISDNDGIGIASFCDADGKVAIKDSDISRNGEQGLVISTSRTQLKNTTVKDNALEGIDTAYPLKVQQGSVISGNGLDGIRSYDGLGFCPRLSVQDSTVTGNGVDAACGVDRTCADLSACEAPTIQDTTCGTSYDENSGFPGTDWSVCSLD